MNRHIAPPPFLFLAACALLACVIAIWPPGAGTSARAWSSAPAGLMSIPSGGEPLWGLDIRLDASGKSSGGRHLPGYVDPSGFLLEKNLALAVDPSDPNLALAGYEMQSVAGVDSYYAASSDGGL